MRSLVVVTVLVALTAALAACGQTANGRTSDGRLRVIAGENFWGDLAAQIGGDHVAVTSLISNPDADPHLFEASIKDGFEVATAGVVIVNGAGYDPFMDRMLAAAPSSSRRVVRVSDVLHLTGSDPNPHLWYDAPRVPQVVHAIADTFAAADPRHAAAYQAGATRTVVALQPLEHAVQRLRASDAGRPVAYTERVPGYLLSAAGLRVLTPPGFARSIEDGTDPSPSDVLATRALVTGHRIDVLLDNEQATSPVTGGLVTLARANGIPVVPVTETMPEHDTFEAWQLGEVRALMVALSR